MTDGPLLQIICTEDLTPAITDLKRGMVLLILGWYVLVSLRYT